MRARRSPLSAEKAHHSFHTCLIYFFDSMPRFEEDDWVIVNYENAWYPGKVVGIADDSATVKCLEFVKVSVDKVSTWKWPSHPDVQKYLLERLKEISLYRP